MELGNFDLEEMYFKLYNYTSREIKWFTPIWKQKLLTNITVQMRMKTNFSATVAEENDQIQDFSIQSYLQISYEIGKLN